MSENIAIDSIRIPAGRRSISEESVKGLADSIQELGLLNPITVTPGGMLLAGLHRVEACRLLGWTEIPCYRLELESEPAQLHLMWELAEIDENLIRNDLTVLERAEQELRRKGVYEQLHPESVRPKGGRPPKNAAMVATFTDDTAKKTGIPTRTIRADVQIASSLAPKAKDLIRNTPVADSTTELLTLAKMPEQAQVQVAEVIATSGIGLREAQKEVKERERRERYEALAAPDAPEGKFRVIYADPPWKYADNRQGLKGYSGAEDHYPTMSIEELSAMAVAEWADDDAVLFLWVPSPMLAECWPVIAAWEFTYKASFIWDKVAHNYGHYNSVRHEFLLVCTKGSCVPDTDKLLDSVVSVERTDKHSEKPEEFRRMIETLYQRGRRLELFARAQHEQWTCWGNECGDSSRLRDTDRG